jgi:hypothetical protein
MADCGHLKVGDIVTCGDCGLEMKVTKACDCGSEAEGACEDSGFSCCGKAMEKK